jgi:hypothetical protein
VNDKDFIDVCAMLAMMGKIINGTPWKPEQCFYLANCMLEVRNRTPEQEVGITTVKPRKRTPK